VPGPTIAGTAALAAAHDRLLAQALSGLPKRSPWNKPRAAMIGWAVIGPEGEQTHLVPGQHR
jgi:hypothetical protein